MRLASGWSLGWVVADFLPGVAFLACGTLAWERRPDSRIGPLMIATGFAWYFGTYGASPDLGRLAYAFQGWFLVFLAWLVLAYPSGHLRSMAARLAIVSLVALFAIRSIVRFADFHMSTEYDLTIPSEIDRYVASDTFKANADVVFGLLIDALAITVLVLVVNRLRTETNLGRRVAGPILLGGIAFAIANVVDTAALASANSFAERIAAWSLRDSLIEISGALVPIGFLVGLARSRITRGRVADLVVELGQPSGDRGGSDLEVLVARALRDPSLRLVHAVDGSDRFVDGEGVPVELPRPDDGRRAVTRLEVRGRTIAALVHDPALVEQPELIRSVAAAAGLALENERLAADVRAQLEEVRKSRARIVAAGDAERRRIERDIHDGAQQQLVTVALLLETARIRAADGDAEVAATVANAAAQLESALAELRRLARGLHPVVLVEAGLKAATEALADRTPVPITVRVTDERFSPDLEATAWFVVAEAVTNAVRHARAQTVLVAIERRNEILEVDVVDDGIGGADRDRGSGLSGLEDRVAAAGGSLTVRSEASAGTTIRAELPCG